MANVSMKQTGKSVWSHRLIVVLIPGTYRTTGQLWPRKRA